MRASFLCLGFAFCSIILRAQQPPEIEWQRCLGGTGNDNGVRIRPTNDGGYILLGSTRSNNGQVTGYHGENDIWVVKLNAAGTLQWQRALGGTLNESPGDIQFANDGGYFISGGTLSSNGDVSGFRGGSDGWLVKLSASGVMEWQRPYGGTGDESFRESIVLPDGGLILVGQSSSTDGDVTMNQGSADFWVVHTDASGEILWQKSYGGTGLDQGRSICLAPDGFIVQGVTSSNNGDVSGMHGVEDIWVIRINGQGDLQWQRCLGGSAQEWSSNVIQAVDGGFIVAGATESNNGDVSGSNGGWGDGWLVKLDDDGAIVWQRTFGGSGGEGVGVFPAQGGNGYLLLDGTDSNDGDVNGQPLLSDIWLLRVDTVGNILWQDLLGGSASDGAGEISMTMDGGYVATGFTLSNDNDVSGNQGGSDVWVVKLGADDVGMAEERALPTLVRYPNPCTDLLQVVNPSPTGASLPWRITDAQGRTVRTGMLGGSLGHVPVAALANGAYTIGLEWNGQWVTAPFVKE